MNWYIGVLKQYAVFSGRAGRQEYWMFSLFHAIITIALSAIEGLVGGPGIAGIIYGLATILPCIGVSIRRLHDTSRSGWWLLIGLIPIIGSIILIVFFVFDSTPEENQYGLNPKAAAA